MIDAFSNFTTRYYYDGWRVLSECNYYDPPADDPCQSRLRNYVYGNYLDEVWIMIDDSNDHYYVNDHLYSPDKNHLHYYP